MENLKIEDTPGWVKNPTSKAVLNSDMSALIEYKAKKQKDCQLNTMNSEIVELKSEIEELKLNVGDIKNILLQFIQSSNK